MPEAYLAGRALDGRARGLGRAREVARGQRAREREREVEVRGGRRVRIERALKVRERGREPVRARAVVTLCNGYVSGARGSSRHAHL
jgi:hypothetical protein